MILEGRHHLAAEIPHRHHSVSEGQEELVFVQKDEGVGCEELGFVDLHHLVTPHLLK